MPSSGMCPVEEINDGKLTMQINRKYFLHLIHITTIAHPSTPNLQFYKHL